MDPQLSQDTQTPINVPDDPGIIQKLSEHSYTPIILTAVMLILLFLTTAFIAYRASPSQEAAKVEVADDTPVPTSSLKADTKDPEAEGWKKYTNEEYGIIFKYPPNWSERDNIFLDQEIGSKFKISFGPVDQPGSMQANYPSFTFQVTDQSTTDVEQILNQIDTQSSIQAKDPTEVTMSGIRMTKIEIIDMERNYGEDWYVFNLDGNTYVLTTITTNPGNITATDQILSSLKIDKTSDILIGVEYTGGLCPNGACYTSYTIKEDGEILIDDEVKTTLDENQIQSLRELISETDFEQVKFNPFTGNCPTAYDGQEITYTFYLEDGIEVIPSCTYEIDESQSLFSQISEIINDLQ